MTNCNDNNSQQNADQNDWQVRLDFGIREQPTPEQHDTNQNVRASTFEVMP